MRVRVEITSGETSISRLVVAPASAPEVQVARRACRLEGGDCGRGVARAANPRSVVVTLFLASVVPRRGVTPEAVDRGSGGARVVEPWFIAMASLAAEQSHRGVEPEAVDRGGRKARAVVPWFVAATTFPAAVSSRRGVNAEVGGSGERNMRATELEFVAAGNIPDGRRCVRRMDSKPHIRPKALSRTTESLSKEEIS